ncbi:MAG: succinylglutamate desuccinylase/aspartoacylase family protein [archaeon]|nr:succinylglutamate desuccinylase/aspartoacylase family protein [archaeon]
MKFDLTKSLLFILLFVILCVSIGCVSATENLDDDLNNIMLDENNILNEINENDSVEINNYSSNSSDNLSLDSNNDSINTIVNSSTTNSTINSTNKVSTVPVKKITLSISSIVKASSSLKSYISKKKTLPSTIKVGSYKLTIYQFSYIMAVAIKNIKANNKSRITVRNIAYLDYYPYTFKKTISLSKYLAVAKSIVKSGSSNKVCSYVTISSKKADFRVYTYGFAKILSYYKTKKRLPKTALFSSSTLKRPSVFNKDSIKINDILISASSLKNYVIKHKTIPSTVKVGSKSYSISVFSYLLAKSIVNINNGNLNNIPSIKTINPSNPYGAFFYNNIFKSNYLSLAKKLVSYSEKNYKNPKYLSSSLGKVEYQLYAYEFANILDNYKINGNLPSTCTFDSTVFIKKPTSSAYTLTCLNWGSKGTITKNKVLMKNISRTKLVNKIIAMCKKGTPVVAFGNGKGPVVVINSGVHGNELSSQAASFKLINKLASMNSKIKGTIYVIPVISPAATAKNVRNNGINLNSVANKVGTLSNNLIRLSLAVNAKGLGDFHCSRHGGDPGKNVAMGSYNPNGYSAILAKYIASNAKVSSLIYNTAGSEYPGAVEDVANLKGIISVTCEVLTNHGKIESGSVSKSYTMMNYFLKYFGLI